MTKLETARLAKAIVKSGLFTVEIKGEDDYWLELTPINTDPERPWLWHEVRKPADWAKIIMSERNTTR